MMLAIRSGAALAILVLLALAGGLARPASGGGPADDITYQDDSLSITTTADRTGILRIDGVYFDPAKPIGRINIGGLAFSTRYLVSSVSETELGGTTRTASCIHNFPCVFNDPEPFLLSGPVDTPPGPDDTLFFGTVAYGGRITVAMNSGEVTAFTLEGAPISCPLDIHAFDFNTISADPLVLVERIPFEYLNVSLIEVEQQDDHLLTGKISVCGAFPWVAIADTVGGIAELPDAALAPLEASSSGPSGGVVAGVVAAVAAGAIALGGGLLAARRQG